MEKTINFTLKEDGTYEIESNFEAPEQIVFWLEKMKLKVFEDTFKAKED